MPYYYRRRRYQRRRRWPWRWRPRKTFFRRYRRQRRRRHRVRRKLKTLTVKEMQPKNIRLCIVKGLHCMLWCTEQTIHRNFRMWEMSKQIENWPGGGGFSVTKYTMDGLYEQHQLDRNWWTQSNRNLPLVRYLWCKLKLYQSSTTDYVLLYHTTYPMLATMLLYQSSQPSFMMMNKNCIFIPSKKTEPWKKPYKTIKIPPPEQMLNKWFFAKNFAKTGLLLVQVAACSFDEYYISIRDTTSTIRFYSLNCYFWQRHDFIQPPINGGYTPLAEGTVEKHIWFTQMTTTNYNTLKPQDVILLGNTRDNQPGTQVSESNKKNYLTEHTYWGNPFRHEYLVTDNSIILISTKMLSLWADKFQNPNKPFNEVLFTKPTNPMIDTIAYTPWNDTGQDNKIYLKSVGRDTSNWDPPHDEDLIASGFPLWVLLHGFIDWQIQLQSSIQIHRNFVLVIQSQFLTPTRPYHIPIDNDFYEGNSPYHEQGQGHITDTDAKNWYPCVMFQLQTIAKIVNAGPGTPKIPPNQSIQAKIKYNFAFKFGGYSPKMDTIADPTKQEVYPIPGCESATYSLQNPALPPEMYLYQFDAPQDYITKKATDRISKAWKTETTMFTGTRLHPQVQEETSESDEEAETTALLFKYRQQRRELKYYQQQLEALLQQP
nr:MAG: ORF1 [TTV-like mini virus]